MGLRKEDCPGAGRGRGNIFLGELSFLQSLAPRLLVLECHAPGHSGFSRLLPEKSEAQASDGGKEGSETQSHGLSVSVSAVVLDSSWAECNQSL